MGDELVLETAAASPQLGITNVLEDLDAVKQVGLAYKAAKANGTIDWKDALNKETRDLIPKLQAAAKDGGMVLAELKDMDPAEAEKVYAALVETVAVLADAVFA